MSESIFHPKLSEDYPPASVLVKKTLHSKNRTKPENMKIF